MKSPITGKEMIKMTKEDVIIFRKESLPILYHYYFCEDSKEEFTDEILENLNLNQVYNQYRAKYNLPFPDQIKAIREQYGVNQTKMADILGFGVNVYRQYENGEIPSISNGRLIQLAADPAEFKKLLTASRIMDHSPLDNVRKKIEALIAAKDDFHVNGLPQYLMTGSNDGIASVFTGYKTPSLKKLIEMTVYFAEKLKPWKTKLNKLLFYADFLHYKKTGFSISGTEYIAIQMGPVPYNFSSIFEYAAANDHVDITYQEFQSGGIGESFTPHHNRAFDPSLFDAEEIATLNTIFTQLGKASTSDIIRLSHEEAAWAENFNGKNKISYTYAFRLIHA
jgi:putative zinc finger/helix-turn-helix YgiT family protein